jgi:TonB family protein
MKKEILASLFLHLLIILFLILYGSVKSTARGYPTVYRVGLVSMPKSGGAGTTGSGAKAQISNKEIPDKGLTLKQLEKEKVTKKKKSTEPDLVEKSLKTKGKETSSKEKTFSGNENSDLNLGDGFGSFSVEGGSFESSYYLDIVLTKIKGFWKNPIRKSSAPIRATIYFRIDKAGKIIDAKVEKSSKIDAFDQASLRAVLASDPVPSLPKEYTGDILGVHLEFEFVQ